MNERNLATSASEYLKKKKNWSLVSAQFHLFFKLPNGTETIICNDKVTDRD